MGFCLDLNGCVDGWVTVSRMNWGLVDGWFDLGTCVFVQLNGFFSDSSPLPVPPADV